MTDTAEPGKQGEPGLVRQLGLFDSTMVVVGIVVGTGIFVSTGYMAELLPSPGLILLAWVVGGAITVAGALTYAELGAAMPAAGGQYVFIREAYGRLTAFLFGWIFFLAYLCGVIAYASLAFADYLGYFLPSVSTENILFTVSLILRDGREFAFSLSTRHIVALLVIALLSLVNFFGVALGKGVQNFFSVVKIVFIGVFIVWGLTAGDRPPMDLSINPTGLPAVDLITGFGLALLTASVAFGGWDVLTFLGGEIKNPARNLTRALFIGVGIVTTIYLLINLVYLRALTIDQMAGSESKIAEDAAFALRGTGATGIVNAMVLVSIFGGINGVILAGPRIYYAMARDGVFFRRAGNIHPRFRTPGFAILIQAMWAAILALTGSVDQLITLIMFVAMIFGIVTASSVFVLRRTKPDMERPYRVWGYPFVPIIFIVSSCCIMLNALYGKPLESLAGLGLLALGLPVYYFWCRRAQESPSDGA